MARSPSTVQLPPAPTLTCHQLHRVPRIRPRIWVSWLARRIPPTFGMCTPPAQGFLSPLDVRAKPKDSGSACLRHAQWGLFQFPKKLADKTIQSMWLTPLKGPAELTALSVRKRLLLWSARIWSLTAHITCACHRKFQVNSCKLCSSIGPLMIWNCANGTRW